MMPRCNRPTTSHHRVNSAAINEKKLVGRARLSSALNQSCSPLSDQCSSVANPAMDSKFRRRPGDGFSDFPVVMTETDPDSVIHQSSSSSFLSVSGKAIKSCPHGHSIFSTAQMRIPTSTPTTPPQSASKQVTSPRPR